MELPTNLTANQSDYAVFLPALSTFYALFVGRQRRGLLPFDENLKGSGTPYIDPARIPQGLPHGVEGLNWLAPEGLWQYKWSLHSAGHASLDLEKDLYREDMYRVRNRETSWLLGDSGGFQIGKGKWEGDWRAGSGCAQAQKKREGVLRWMDKFMDYGMILDIPAWVDRSPEGSAASKISSYQEAADGTKYNNEYFIKNRTGDCKFLNVLQGENFAQADDWYAQMKHLVILNSIQMHILMAGQWVVRICVIYILHCAVLLFSDTMDCWKKANKTLCTSWAPVN